ncbi:hypothetical protein EJB05_05570 [Eragrostis curvula]|uniref:Ubiquitin-like protease family profile domain-containing protein n=1 Tax=Eragrostis curvula TaxID=38414 RepID=A0A5J9WBC8_9POAL|nr:hypothetical protein EJB05_05570 [Eragrostis curvula]
MQTDSSSCGLFMLKYIECWTGTNLCPYFTQGDIDNFRKKITVLLVDSKHNKIRKEDQEGDRTNPYVIEE